MAFPQTIPRTLFYVSPSEIFPLVLTTAVVGIFVVEIEFPKLSFSHTINGGSLVLFRLNGFNKKAFAKHLPEKL